jgi:hypothetical protein
MYPCENGVQTIRKSVGKKRLETIQIWPIKEKELHGSTLVGELGEGERGGGGVGGNTTEQTSSQTPPEKKEWR